MTAGFDVGVDVGVCMYVCVNAYVYVYDNMRVYECVAVDVIVYACVW